MINRHRVNSQAFVNAWNDNNSIEDVALVLEMKQVTVRTRANYLRKKGWVLKCLCCHCPEKRR